MGRLRLLPDLCLYDAVARILRSLRERFVSLGYTDEGVREALATSPASENTERLADLWAEGYERRRKSTEIGSAAEALVQEGKAAEGLERYRELAARVQDPDLKPRLEERVRALEQFFVKDREVAAYNHAIELARKQDLAGASAALTALLASCTTPDLCAKARELLGEVEARRVRP